MAMAVFLLISPSGAVAHDEAPTTLPATGEDGGPPADPSSRARHSEPSIFTPPVEVPPGSSLIPGTLRPLQPYLQMANRFGTHAVKPGGLIENDPVSSGMQDLKAELAKIGLRYSFDQTLIMSAMSDRVQGDSVIGAYSHGFFGNWTIFESDDLGGSCGWITAKSEGTLGLGYSGHSQSPRRNIGAISSPNNNYKSYAFAVDQLAWAQSFGDGAFVAMAGQINQENYLDINRYANSSHGQFINASLVNSMVIPAPGNNLGIQLQWQPCESFYAMFGAGPNNQNAGESPFVDISWENESYCGEFGFIVKDLWGWGPGTYRVQPFVATWEGETGGGVAFNLEQQLGAGSPLGFFARAGFGDDVTGIIPGDVKTQVSAGLAMLAPFGDRGFLSHANDDFAGVGFIWSQPVDAPGLDHRNEYAIEATLAFQITATATLQPDVQLIWDPINNPDDGPAVVAQLQLNIAW